MSPILANLQILIFVCLVVLVTVFVRRNFGWGWLILVWVGLSALASGGYTLWFYHISPLTPDDPARVIWTIAIYLFMVLLLLSGMVVWLVSIIVLPRTVQADVPSTEPLKRAEDTHELMDLPQRYQALLLTHREAIKQAVSRPWYHEIFRGYVPSYVREDLVSSVQLWRAPDVFKRNFVAAARVLRTLSELPTTQLSALEAYHRVNLKRWRRRLAPAKAIPGVVFAIIIAASRALPSGTIDIKKWDAVQASIIAFVTHPEYKHPIEYFMAFVVGLIIGTILVWLMQRRLEALSELLTVALAHRYLTSETPN